MKLKILPFYHPSSLSTHHLPATSPTNPRPPSSSCIHPLLFPFLPPAFADACVFLFLHFSRLSLAASTSLRWGRSPHHHHHHSLLFRRWWWQKNPWWWGDDFLLAEESRLCSKDILGDAFMIWDHWTWQSTLLLLLLLFLAFFFFKKKILGSSIFLSRLLQTSFFLFPISSSLVGLIRFHGLSTRLCLNYIVWNGFWMARTFVPILYQTSKTVASNAFLQLQERTVTHEK